MRLLQSAFRTISMTQALRDSVEFTTLADLLRTRTSSYYYPVLFSQCTLPSYYFALPLISNLVVLPLAMLTKWGMLLLPIPMGMVGYYIKQTKWIYSLRVESDLKGIQIMTRSGQIILTNSELIQLIDIQRIIVGKEFYRKKPSPTKHSDDDFIQRIIQYNIKLSSQPKKQVAWKLLLLVEGSEYMMLIREHTQGQLERGEILIGWLQGRLKEKRFIMEGIEGQRFANFLLVEQKVEQKEEQEK